jgi:type IV fimbrial biogenesis protein FimT
MNRIRVLASRNARHGGFSLVELIVVLAVASILVSIAVPSFLGLLGRMRVATAINDFRAAVKATRNEALSRGIRVDMVPNDQTTWTSGWTIFVDSDNDQIPDSGETVIRRHGGLSVDITIEGGAFYDDDANKRYLSFNAAGYPKENSGAAAMDSLIVHNQHAKRKLVISMLGRVRICNPDADRAC